MGGRVWLDSRVGRGSTFHFSLPLAVHEGSVEQFADAVATRLSRQSVLLVSDDAALNSVVGEMLGHWSIKSSTVASIDEALQALGRGNFDVLVVDSDLQGDEIALFHTASDLRILSLVGEGLRDGALPYHRKFGVQLLGKPVSQSELWNALLPAAETTAGPSDSKRGVPPLRVLLVEDNVVNQNLAMMMLKGYGHDVKVASNGEEALSMFEVFPFDLILMDVQMPVMDGLEATRQIRQLEASAGGDATPILALTAHALKGDRERCLEAGMDGYLTKPISEAQLWATVTTAIPAEVLSDRWAEQDRLERLEAAKTARELEPMAAKAAKPSFVLPKVRFDRDALLGRVGRSEDNLRKIVSLFLDNGPLQMEKLSVSLGDGDRVQAAKEAHTLKGMLVSLAADPAGELAAGLEQLLADGGSAEDCASALANLQAELDQLAIDLQQELTPVASR